jgi:electron transfer flavoprotein alpha subunit
MSMSIWVVVQRRDDQLHRMSLEALAAAQALRETVGGEVRAIVLGADVAAVADSLRSYDLAGVWTLEHPALAAYTPTAYVAALKALMAEHAPDLVLFPHTYQAVDFVPRLAQMVGAALVAEATEYANGAEGLVWRRPILGGKLSAKVRVRGEGCTLVTLQSGSFSHEDVRPGECATEAYPLDGVPLEPEREILGVEEVGGDQVDLSQAQVIVAVGRGIGGADKMAPVEELAGLLGAEIGASRPVIDNGWLSRDRQIGSSGQTVTPKLYIALGISGAIQHLVGMKGSQTIVAVNKDPNAPIFGVSRYGIVGDVHEVLPALIDAVRAASA